MAYYIPNQVQPQGLYPADIVYYSAPVIAYEKTVTRSYRLHFARQTSTILGAVLIVLACISIAAGVVAIIYEAGNGLVGGGIWCGTFHLIAGSIAIAAGQQATNQLITATVACSAFDTFFGIVELWLASIGVSQDIQCSASNYNGCESWSDGAIAANSLMIGVAALVIIFGIWLMVVSGHAIYKGNKAKIVTIRIAHAATQTGTVFTPEPALQPQPKENQCKQLQFPSLPNPQKIMYAEDQHVLSMIINSEAL